MAEEESKVPLASWGSRWTAPQVLAAIVGAVAALAIALLGIFGSPQTRPKAVEVLWVKVSDAYSGDPVKHARVAVIATQDGKTDSEGRSGLAVGSLGASAKVEVTAEGYDPFDRQVNIMANEPFHPIRLIRRVSPTPYATPTEPRFAATPGAPPLQSTPNVPPLDATSHFRIEANIARSFSDYARVENASVTTCAIACWADARCKAFDYDSNKQSWGYQSCWLKDKVPSPVPVVGITSGVKLGS